MSSKAAANKGKNAKAQAQPKSGAKQPGQKTQEKDLLFILDIGTRSVIGVVGRLEEEMLHVLSVESAEHSERAVVDGQIEDIEQTARIAGQVKARLEKNLGVTLTEVHVAAAGRVLKTEHVTDQLELDEQKPIGAKELATLEASAVQKAYQKLVGSLGEGDPTDFCSVGHTVVGYQLDGYSFSTLTGHKGRLAGIDLIATFLPSEVVESLYTTMSMIGLSITSMTLEPIAAMNAVVPKELRLLNVALVDVGAGTSDIAVANKGSVCGYTMATIAGDEVTERIMQEFLVDFAMAESMKFAASAGEESIEFTDVLGFPDTVTNQELLQRIGSTIQELAHRIAEGIISINEAAPKAVFMVGGGSRTPGLCQLVAGALGVDEKKVAIGGNNYMKRQIVADPQYLSAEYATPIGIAVTAMTSGNGENFAISLNGSRLQLLGRTMTVMDALRRGGFQYGQIMGRSGKSVAYELNGQRRIARGDLPTLAEVRVNGALSGLSTPLQAGDEVYFLPAMDGADATPRVADVVENWETFPVELFGETVEAGVHVLINGIMAEGSRLIRQHDRLEVRQAGTMGGLLKSMGFGGWEEDILLNGHPCTGPEQPLRAGDRIELVEGSVHEDELPSRQAAAAPEPTLQPQQAPVPAAIPIAEPISGPYSPSEGLQVTINGKGYLLPRPEGGGRYQLFDLFNYVDVDPSRPRGKLILRRNGADATSYLEPIQDMDQVEIFWSEDAG